MSRSRRTCAVVFGWGGDSLISISAALRSGLSPESVSGAILRILPVFMLLALLLRPFGYADLGWQLKLGEIIHQQGSPFVREPFAATHIGETLTPNAWLGQLIFAQVRAWSGLPGLRAFDALLWVGGVLAAAIPAWRRSERPLAILFALIVGFVVALPSASIRPQSFAVLAFGLTLALIQTVKSPRLALLIGLPLFILWQNLHPSVPVAAVMIGLAAAVRWILHMAGAADRPWTLTGLAVAASVATLATPAGWSIIGFARYNEDVSRFMGATEWFPLWSPFNRTFLWLVLLATVLAAIVVYRTRDRARPEEIVPLIVSLSITVLAARFIPFLGIALVPVLAKAEIGRHLHTRTPFLYLASGLACAAITAELIFIPIRFEPELPVTAVRKLSQLHLKGTIFCDPYFGGLIIDTGYPDWTVAFDGRFYRYSPREWLTFKDTSTGPVRLSDIDRSYHPVAYVLAPSRSQSLIRALRANPMSWHEFYADNHSIVFVKSPDAARK